MRITIKLDIAATPKKFTIKCLDVSIILKNCSILFLPMLSTPFHPVTPVVTAKMILTDGLAVTTAGHVLNG